MAIPFMGILAGLAGKLIIPIMRSLLPGLFGKSTEQKLSDAKAELRHRDKTDEARKRIHDIDELGLDGTVDELRNKGL